MLTDDFVTKMQELCQNENLCLFEMGDLLVKAQLAEEDMRKLAQIVQRKASTLRQRERVAREITSDMRDSKHSWTVYAELIRITEKKDRVALLASRAEWTVEAIRKAVDDFIEIKSGRPRRVRVEKAGLKVGDVTITAELTGDDLAITIKAPTGDVTPIKLSHATILHTSLI